MTTCPARSGAEHAWSHLIFMVIYKTHTTVPILQMAKLRFREQEATFPESHAIVRQSRNTEKDVYVFSWTITDLSGRSCQIRWKEHRHYWVRELWCNTVKEKWKPRGKPTIPRPRREGARGAGAEDQPLRSLHENGFPGKAPWEMVGWEDFTSVLGGFLFPSEWKSNSFCLSLWTVYSHTSRQAKLRNAWRVLLNGNIVLNPWY